MVGFSGSVPEAAGLHLVDGVPLLRPEEQVFAAMLTGFANPSLPACGETSSFEWALINSVQVTSLRE